ncbi:transferase [Candidatus Poribacteria bacterium]|nr:transferase [Candidatus Poribacteria bacterium]
MRIAIIGAGGHGKAVLDAALESNEYQVAGIVDDNKELVGTYLFGVPVFNCIDELDGVEAYTVAIGDNVIRKRKFQQFQQMGYKPVNIKHASVYISPRVSMGQGSVILACAVITANAVIGDNVVLYTSCTIEHDCIISDHSYISPGCNVCGAVNIHEGAMIGTGAVIMPGVTVGEWSVVGAGAVVNRDVEPGITVVGIPAGNIKHREKI